MTDVRAERAGGAAWPRAATWRGALAAAATLVVALSAAPAAQAAVTFQHDPATETLRVTGTSGDDDVAVIAERGGVMISDDTSGSVSHCAPNGTETEGRCGGPRITVVEFELGDGNDRVDWLTPLPANPPYVFDPPRYEVDLGPGSDLSWMQSDANANSVAVEGADGNDLIIVENGVADLSGGDGDDRIDNSSASPEGLISGGAGRDSLYWGRGVVLGTVPLFISLDGQANDGSTGQRGANIAPDFEEIITSEGDDTIDASMVSHSVLIEAYGGDNTVRGGSGDDVLRTFESSGTNTITGGAGNDDLQGGSGPDTLDGGTGADSFFGGAGNDTVNASVGLLAADPDRVISCGAGQDSATLDLSDLLSLAFVTTLTQGACETLRLEQ